VALFTSAGALVTALITATAQAGVIYDNDAPPINAAAQSDAVGFIRAEDFSLAAGATTITDVHWTGLYALNNVTPADNFRLEFFGDTGSGGPLSAPFLSLAIGNNAVRVDSGIDVAGIDLYRYSVDFTAISVAPVLLSPGTPYWLSIFNDTGGDDVPNSWAWGGRLTGLSGDELAIRNASSDVWGSQSGTRLDFQLTDDAVVRPIPEPATVWLVVLALLGIAGCCGRPVRRSRIGDALRA
jgi:hypothetical protein